MNRSHNVSILAIISALVIGFFNISLIILAAYVFKVSVPIQIYLYPTLLITLISFLIIRFILQEYIRQRIIPIYKIIHKHERGDDQSMKSNVDSIELVKEDVGIWIKEREEEVNKFKTLAEYRKRFIGDISHELKTPLFSIQSYLDTLIEGALYDKENNLKFLKKAAKNTDRLRTIIEDLEIIARLESGEYGLDIESFSINDLIEDVFDELQIKAEKAQISLVQKSSNIDYTVSGDTIQIRQVLNNLINNSIKYGKSGGKTEVSYYDMDKRILIEISDDGLGIAKDHLPHVFGRFYRVDKSRSREKGGSGLGLSIVKHIIEAHKQTINVKSTSGIGTTFGFTLEKA